MSEFQQWLASQVIYTPEDVQQINAKLAAQIQAMPASEMQEYMDQWQAKLKVLDGKNFQEAQAWLGAYLLPCADGYRAQVLKQLGLTDVADMSAAQLNDAILRISEGRLSCQQSRSSYTASQQQMQQSVQQRTAASQQAQQQAATVGMNYGSGAGSQSPYSPSKFNPPPPPEMHFYVNGNGQIGYTLPF